MKYNISIIIPAFEESERLGDSLKLILAYLVRENLNAELIVVDDGSGDNTAEIAETTCAEFPNVPTKVIRYEQNRGKGYAVKIGLLAAQGEIALFSDADLSTPIAELVKLVKPIEEGKFDVTFGSRALDRSLIGTHQSWRREQGGKVFNFIVRFLTKLPFWDTQCGFKAFNMNKFRPLLDVMQIERFGFDVEFLYVANLAKLRLEEIAVRWNHCDGTKVSVFRDSQRMFREVNEIRRNDKNGVYDKVKYQGERLKDKGERTNINDSKT
jgi:dolichyl-phosphate beta-glucosyltransferase